LRLLLKGRGAPLFAAIGLSLAASATQAQTYPDRPVTFISDAPPGLSSDVATRIVAEQLSTLWKQHGRPQPAGRWRQHFCPCCLARRP